MNILVENGSMKVWMDDHAPIVFSKLFTAPDDLDKFVQFCKKNIQGIERIGLRKQRVAYCICDATAITPSDFEIFIGYYLHHLPGLFKAGLNFQAIIKPGEIPTSSWVHDFTSDVENRLNIFDCFEKALDNVNKRWAVFYSEATKV